MTEQKKHNLKIILITFAIIVIFLFAAYLIYKNFFTTTTQPSPEVSLPEISGVGHPTESQIGYVDTSIENKVKVCKDVSCTNPKPGIIDFNVSDRSPLVINTDKGISGKVWGDELGWITFNPSYGGVFITDPATGLLKGIASSQNSDAINFSVTGQKVVIDPVTGEWNGWAWASGPYGGWIKFDCKNASCVKMVWSGQAKTITKVSPSSPSPKLDLGENKKKENYTPSADSSSYGAYISSMIYPSKPTFPVPASPASSAEKTNIFSQIKEIIYEKGKILGDNFNTIVNKAIYILNKPIQAIGNVYNSVFSFYKKVFIEKLFAPTDPASTLKLKQGITIPPASTATYIPKENYIPSADDMSYESYIFDMTHSPFGTPHSSSDIPH